VRRYLLDTGPLAGYLLGRVSVHALVEPWIMRQEAAASILVYGEITEYNESFPDVTLRQAQLRRLLREVSPNVPTYAILERDAELRRQLRPPRGPGLIGDIDTLIAATALEWGLTLVTMDRDFQRVPDLNLTPGSATHPDKASRFSSLAGVWA
jgi:predicted nucleic acid-binding protein